MGDPRLKLGSHLRDKWRLDGLLGTGGMATVFAATHRNGMRGAIKVLHPDLAKDDQIRARFLREGYVANKVDHPGIVRVLDDDTTDDGLVYLVMELLEGETVKQKWMARSRRLSPIEVLGLGESVLEILVAAHARKVVHRDIKPDNVFLLPDGTIKLLDFGIARLREGPVDMTDTGAMMGTPAFMAPEQALANWDEVDERSDLFSLGATLATLISGRLVHEGGTIPALLVAAATKQVQPFAKVVPDAPLDLCSLLDHALAFDKRDRWASANDMLIALRRAKSAMYGKTIRIEATENPFLEPRRKAHSVPDSAMPTTRAAATERDPPTTVPFPDEPTGEPTRKVILQEPPAPPPRLNGRGGTQHLPVVTELPGPLPVPKPAKTMQSLEAVILRPGPGGDSSTPVRLQEAWPAQLHAPRPVLAAAEATTRPSRSRHLPWILAGFAAVLAVAVLVHQLTKTTEGSKKTRSTSSAATTSPTATSASTGAPSVVPVIDTTEAPPASVMSSIPPNVGSSAPSASASSVTTGPRVRRYPTIPPPRPCVEGRDFGCNRANP